MLPKSMLERGEIATKMEAKDVKVLAELFQPYKTATFCSYWNNLKRDFLVAKRIHLFHAIFHLKNNFPILIFCLDKQSASVSDLNRRLSDSNPAPLTTQRKRT